MKSMRGVFYGIAISLFLAAISGAFAAGLGLSEDLFGVLFLACLAIGTIAGFILEDRAEGRTERHR